MKLRLLGCGTSFGVPRIGNDWGACDPREPRNRRSRASILIEADGTRILVDTTPDLRSQLLDANVDGLDAVIWTHEHADHCHGLDDLRQVFLLNGQPVPGYARERTLETLASRFAYVFHGRHGYPATVQPHRLPDILKVGPITVRTIDQPHGAITTAGLRFEHGGKSIGYSTDFNMLTSGMRAHFEGVNLWVIDALRRKPHPTHSHLERSLEYLKAVRAGRGVLTHMDNSMDYRSLLGELPSHIVPGHDGMEVVL